jgi:dephospho-CoA kinase
VKKLIGLVGEAGSGKSEAARILEEIGFARVSLSDSLREIATNLGMNHSRETLILIGNTMRQQFGGDILARGAQRIVMRTENDFVVIESIRNPQEIVFLRENFDITMIGVVMDPEKKFELMQKRGREGDPKTWQDFLEFRRKERGDCANENEINLNDCLDLCDIKLENNGSLESFEELTREIGFGGKQHRK